MNGNLNVLVLGSGARENVLWWALNKSPLAGRVLCSPGNGGIPNEYRRSVKETDFHGLQKLAEEESINLIVVGPEVPLCNGIVDYFHSEEVTHVSVFGPSKRASMLEADKAFCKELCKRLGVPTPEFEVVDCYEDAMKIIKGWGTPIVVKANGLCAGKGVVVAKTEEKALEAAHDCLVKKVFGDAGDIVVIERCITGRECSVMAVCDGHNAILLPPARDYKRIFDDDEGPNTGGMGAYSPVPDLDVTTLEYIRENMILPVLDEMRKLGCTYRGVLYAGIMLTETGPQLLEFNCRFGDPETQVVVPRLKTDLMELIIGSLRSDGLERFSGGIDVTPEAAVCVVAASKGYPEKPETGCPITWRPEVVPSNFRIFHAGTKLDEKGRLVTSGGRVVSIVGMGKTHHTARMRAYSGVGETQFQGIHWRTDIAKGV